MMAGARDSARHYGKSDPIDAACVARAALREPGLPEARLCGPEHDIRLLTDHRDDLVEERAKIQTRLRWHCHDLELPLVLPPRVLDRYVWLDRLEAELRALPASIRQRIALDELARCRELTVCVRTLEREIRDLAQVLVPELLAFPGCSAIGAAHLVGETAGVSRFGGESAFAMHNGTAPLPVSRQVGALSAEPHGQPEAQLHHPHDRPHPGAHVPAGYRLHGEEAGRRDEPP
jgi:hypothetical protein